MHGKAKIKKIFSKITFFLYIFSTIFFPQATFAFDIPLLGLGGVASVDIPSAVDETTQELEDRYGFDENIWRNAKRKVSAPRVEVFFDNTNPKPGEKVTAHAVPEFFKNDPQNIYYTWYIIHTEDGTIETATNTVSEGKIEASKWMVRGDYDPDLDGQDYAGTGKGDDPDNDGWPAVDGNSYDTCLKNGKEDDSGDCSFAPMGGADGVGGLAEGNENIEPYESASAYCSAQGYPATAEQCSIYDTFSSFNQYYTLQPTQTNSSCAACQASTTFSATLSSDNVCCHVASGTADPYDPLLSYCPSTYQAAYESCFDYAALKTTNKALIESCLSTNLQSCITSWNGLHENPAGDEPVSKVSRCYKHNFGTNNPAFGFRGYQGANNTFGDDSSGTDVVTDCVHKWKDATEYTSGSGKFPTGEEEYWKTDPTDPDTDGDGFVDEADVIGLGQQDFTWTYQAGDRVGVVAEGTSMIPVDEKSAYYKIMWGYLDVCDATKSRLMEGDQCENSDDYGYGFLATKSPSEEGDPSLKISLTYSPDSPLADPSNENKANILSDGTIADADQITVTSSLENTQYNPANLYYTWQISKGDPQEDDWDEVSDLSENFSNASPASGMGVSQFSFTPKKEVLSEDSDISYFKVTLTASTASEITSGRGRSSVIIGINKKGIRVTLHKVEIENGKAKAGDEICNEGLYRTLCPVVKGQMLAAKVSGTNYTSEKSQFSWKINGNPLYIPSTNSYYPSDSENELDYISSAGALFDGWSNTTVFFPITEEEQQIEEITVTATSKEKLSPATGSRLATVVRPAVFIRSSDPIASWPKTYTVEDETKIDTYYNIESPSAFQAEAGAEATYYLDFVPYYLFEDTNSSKIDWRVNGSSIYSQDFYEVNPYANLVDLGSGNQSIKIPIESNDGVFTSLSADVKRYWSNEEKKILFSAWKIFPETLTTDSTVTIESVYNSESIGANFENPGQVLAAIGTHLPHYFMYLLRLVLTMAVMLVASAGFYAISQRINFVRDEK